ncbi:hypothetical protein HYY74_04350 [Candidatus Woesearchaeota archaeon]|nr:hypothetical protein [Candidatus Woesearchaeota archaeon]
MPQLDFYVIVQAAGHMPERALKEGYLVYPGERPMFMGPVFVSCTGRFMLETPSRGGVSMEHVTPEVFAGNMRLLDGTTGLAEIIKGLSPVGSIPIDDSTASFLGQYARQMDFTRRMGETTAGMIMQQFQPDRMARLLGDK